MLWTISPMIEEQHRFVYTSIHNGCFLIWNNGGKWKKKSRQPTSLEMFRDYAGIPKIPPPLLHCRLSWHRVSSAGDCVGKKLKAALLKCLREIELEATSCSLPSWFICTSDSICVDCLPGQSRPTEERKKRSPVQRGKLIVTSNPSSLRLSCA